VSNEEGPINLGEVTDNSVLLLRGGTSGAAEALVERLTERGLRPLVVALPPGDDLRILDDRHLIQFTDSGWTIAHPIRERLDLDTLFDCKADWGGDDPGMRGRFVLEWDEESYDWALGDRL